MARKKRQGREGSATDPLVRRRAGREHPLLLVDASLDPPSPLAVASSARRRLEVGIVTTNDVAELSGGGRGGVGAGRGGEKRVGEVGAFEGVDGRFERGLGGRKKGCQDGERARSGSAERAKSSRESGELDGNTREGCRRCKWGGGRGRRTNSLSILRFFCRFARRSFLTASSLFLRSVGVSESS